MTFPTGCCLSLRGTPCVSSPESLDGILLAGGMSVGSGCSLEWPELETLML